MLSRRDPVFMPGHLRWLYKTFAYVPAATDRNALGIEGYLKQYPSPADLRTFMMNYCDDATAATFTVVKVYEGKYDPRNPSAEANVDIQYAQAIAYPTPRTFYSIGARVRWSGRSKEPARADPFLEWLNYMLAEPKIPQTISTSYGYPDSEKGFPLEYMIAICNLFA